MAVSINQQGVPGENSSVEAESIIHDSLRETAREILQLLRHCPVVTIKVIMDSLSFEGRIHLERALPSCEYTFKNGP
jgi:hypothetical protein